MRAWLRLPAASAVFLAAAFAQQEGWWMKEAFRLVQTNLRETDSNVDPAWLVAQVAEFPATVLLFGMGGIVAHYPTEVEFHYRSPYLPAGRDTFGEVLRLAHARGIRVIGRFDLSKTPKAVYEAHPEWFVRRANGEPVIYNGLYSACINGGYYREHAFKILGEALERYPVDGLFFNMFGNPSTDYSGARLGPCHCANCRRLFRQRHGRDLPATETELYRRFLHECSLEVAAAFARCIHARRPGAGFFTYRQEHVDVIMSESNTAFDRPLPLWPYSASDNVNRARNSQPGKMAVNLCMSFYDYPARFAMVPAPEIQIRLYENMAHGAHPAFTMHGAFNQQDRSGLDAARAVFRFHAAHSDLYVNQRSAARVLLLTSGATSAYRGFFRLLTEQHIPFAVSDNLDFLAGGRAIDLVIAPDGGAPQLDAWVREGGRLLVAGARPLPFAAAAPVRQWEDTQAGYWRIRTPQRFPSLSVTSLLFSRGPYLEYPPQEGAALTFIPPTIFGPPEKVHLDQQETEKPGLLEFAYGGGRILYLPWNIGELYYRHSSPAHAALLADLIDSLLPRGRQLRTNAHPLIEMTLMRQPDRGRTLVHFINLSGHAGTAYFPPLAARRIEVTVEGVYRRARAVALHRRLPVRVQDGRSSFTLPELGAYEVVTLE